MGILGIKYFTKCLRVIRAFLINYYFYETFTENLWAEVKLMTPRIQKIVQYSMSFTKKTLRAVMNKSIIKELIKSIF